MQLAKKDQQLVGKDPENVSDFIVQKYETFWHDFTT